MNVPQAFIEHMLRTQDQTHRQYVYAYNNKNNNNNYDQKMVMNKRRKKKMLDKLNFISILLTPVPPTCHCL